MSRRRKNKNLNKLLFTLIVVIFICIIGYINPNIQEYFENNAIYSSTKINSNNISFDLSSIPDYTNSPYVILNDNKPEFTEEELNSEEFESYSNLDSLGRCGVAMANIGLNLMPSPDQERESISSIEPSGWINKQYDIVDGGYLYNRCHLIGYQLTAENANEKNLITGTRYMNTEGMLPFENEIAEYIKETRNHVLYRVTPIFESNNLVANGVQLEAQSIEDNGKGVCFNVYCYNVQPGIIIDYATGESKEA